MTARWTVVRAAAGCGKTTDLARRYLALLASGVPADRAIAITFTRRAAAELEERVALALRGCLDGDAAEDARRRLGSAWPLYREVAPTDREQVRQALAALPDAPIGTTDAFVQRLLTEHALDAALPLPDGRAIPLDLPIGTSAGVASALARAARRELDPPDGSVDPDVALLVRYLSLDELLPQVATVGRWDDLPLVSVAEVLGTFARAAAEALAGLGLATALAVDEPTPEAWAAALAPLTNQAGTWAIPEVAAWAARGAVPADAPYALCGWLVAVNQARKVGKQIRGALQAEVRPCGPGSLDLWQIVQALRYPYDDPAQVALADALRQARDRVRRRVVARGLEEAALAGELGYDEILAAATRLCERPPPRLQGQFRALLVDEIQDASPGQLRLYRALADLEGMDAYFVGDSRQSIYLFRDAEPEGIRELEVEARRRGQEPLDLSTNRRSTPSLVKAQRELFSRLDDPMRRQRWRPIDDLARLGWDEANRSADLDPAHHQPADPVWIVVPEEGKARDAELDARVLAAFLERVRAAWGEPGHEGDTAVVLAPSWALARLACERLRAWAGRPDAAFVEGGSGRNRGRVTDDLALWLRALLDPSDEEAWVGVWKHPSVGLSDAALARAVRGVGLCVDADDGPAEVPAWLQRPGRWTELDRLGSPHDERDRLAFERALPPIRDAVGRVGRTGTAAVLDRLWTRLDWRAVLAAGPGGEDDLAELEVMLDWVRERDAEGHPPDLILAMLSDERLERPQVHVGRPAGHIVCTTVFQAKGLAWDHVCVLRVGQHSRSDPARDEQQGWMALGDRRVRLDGFRFDPRGGLSPFRDPLARLAAALQRLRYTEETARLAYVALTRARRSVTFGLSRANRSGKQTQEPTLGELLAETWLSGDPPEGVVRVPRPVAPEPGAPPTAWVRPTGALLPPPPAPGRTWSERAPSNLGAHLGADDRSRLADWVVTRVRLENGLHRGGPPLAPPGTDPRTGLPTRGHPLAHLGPADWGNLAHGWLAEWAFGDEVDRDAVDAYLRDGWGAAPPEVRDWLVALCAQLRTVGGPLWEEVTATDAKLHFEHPLVGLGRGDTVLLSGRIDLLVERRGRTSVIDFKAGSKVPSSFADLAEGASLQTYAPQLHAYADALRVMGRAVGWVALWFVRTGTSVRWSPS